MKSKANIDTFIEEVFPENIDYDEKVNRTSSTEHKEFENLKESDVSNEYKVDTPAFIETIDLGINKEDIEYIQPFSEEIDEIDDGEPFKQEPVKDLGSVVFLKSKKYFLLLFSLLIIVFIVEEIKILVENMLNGSILDGFY